MTIYLYGRFFSLSVKNYHLVEQNNITIKYLNYNIIGNVIILKVKIILFLSTSSYWLTHTAELSACIQNHLSSQHTDSKWYSTRTPAPHTLCYTLGCTSVLTPVQKHEFRNIFIFCCYQENQ